VWPAELAALKRRHPGVMLVVDEAHATLVCGVHGGGAVVGRGGARLPRGSGLRGLGFGVRVEEFEGSGPALRV
jgi:hypothetical protein